MLDKGNGDRIYIRFDSWYYTEYIESEWIHLIICVLRKEKVMLFARKKIVFTIFALLCSMLLTGCALQERIIVPIIDKLAMGKMYGSVDCSVLLVEGSIGSSHYICENSTDTYVYDKENIYNYNTGEMLEELLSVVE